MPNDFYADGKTYGKLVTFILTYYDGASRRRTRKQNTCFMISSLATASVIAFSRAAAFPINL